MLKPVSLAEWVSKPIKFEPDPPGSPGMERNSASYRRNWLPYGKWTCADGRQVLFNRGYRPILQRMPDGSTSRADWCEGVDYVADEHFYDDGDKEPEKRRMAIAALKEWGLSPPRSGTYKRTF